MDHFDPCGIGKNIELLFPDCVEDNVSDLMRRHARFEGSPECGEAGLPFWSHGDGFVTKFRRPVVPGDQVRIEVKVLNWRSTAVRMQGTATVEGKVVCEATVMCALVPRAAKKPDAAAQKAEG